MSEWRKAFERLSPPGASPASSRERGRDKADKTDKNPSERQAVRPRGSRTRVLSVLSLLSRLRPLERRKLADVPAAPRRLSLIATRARVSRRRRSPLGASAPARCQAIQPHPLSKPRPPRILVILELAGAAPRLGPDGRLTLGHPQCVSDDMRAAATLHQDDIEAILEYRALLDACSRSPPLDPPTETPMPFDQQADLFAGTAHAPAPPTRPLPSPGRPRRCRNWPAHGQ